MRTRLELRSGDVLTEDFADGWVYDVVFVQAAIHHFFDIEAMYQLMHRVLKPDGLLIFDEYIGPDHHIYDDHVHRALMNRIDACLAPRYKWDVLAKHRAARGCRSLHWSGCCSMIRPKGCMRRRSCR